MRLFGASWWQRPGLPLIGLAVLSLCQQTAAQAETASAEMSSATAFTTVDLAWEAAPAGITMTNISRLETDNRRWALGPETTLTLEQPLPAELTISLRFSNPIERQDVEILFNGEVLGSLVELVKGVTFERSYRVKTQAGVNTLSFRYAHWNQQEGANAIERTRLHLAPTDARAMAILLHRLTLSAAPPAPLGPCDADLIKREWPASLELSGFGALEDDAQRATGDHATIAFRLEQAGSVWLTTRFVTTLEGQSVELSFNGTSVRHYLQFRPDAVAVFKLELEAQEGLDTLRFDFTEWRGDSNPLLEDDPRPLAVFDVLELRQAY